MAYFLSTGGNNTSPITDFTSQITFDGSIGGDTHFYKKDKVIYLNYQGTTGTHATDDVLFTLPSEYRPTASLSVPFILNNSAFGVVNINYSTGICKINFLSNSSANGRIYFNVAYPIS